MKYSAAELYCIETAERKDRQRLQSEIDQLQDSLSELQAAADAATASNEIEQSADYFAKIQAVKARIQWLQREMHKPCRLYTADDVKEAWRKYATEYNAQATQTLMRYSAARRQLAAQWLSIVRQQNEALALQGKLAALYRRATGDDSISDTPPADFVALKTLPVPAWSQVKAIEGGSSMPCDVAFFTRSGEVDRSRAFALTQIVGYKSPCNLDTEYETASMIF